MVFRTSTWLWVIFTCVSVGAVFTDALLHRAELSVRRAWMRTCAWLALGFGFSVVVGLGEGRAAAGEYVAAFLIEKGLSLDNLAAFALVFGALRIPPGVQHRVVTAGIVGAAVTRGSCIAAGVGAMHNWHGATYVFAALLAVTAVRTALAKDDAGKPPWVLSFVMRHTSLVESTEGRFFVRAGDHWVATTMVLAVVAIEFTDIVFALDSIPSALAVTTRPFVLFSSNMFAVLGLRALFVLLMSALSSAPRLKYGIALVLFSAAVKLLISRWLSIPPLVMAAVVVCCLVPVLILRPPHRDSPTHAGGS